MYRYFLVCRKSELKKNHILLESITLSNCPPSCFKLKKIKKKFFSVQTLILIHIVLLNLCQVIYLLVLFYSTSTNLSAERWRSRPSFKGHVVYMREYYMLLIFQLISDFKKTNRQRVDGCCKKIWAEKKKVN